MLIKFGHFLADGKGRPYSVGDRVYVPCINQHGTLMDAGWPQETESVGMGEIVLDFNGWAVPIYPEVVGAKWVKVRA